MYKDGLQNAVAISLGFAAALGLGALAPPMEFFKTFSTFALAGVVGYQVVWGVTPALHSPLMSVTNAVSGIIIVGGMLTMGGGYVPDSIPTFLAATSVAIASMNIFGGFLVTQRMLNMFKRPTDPKEYNHLLAIPGFLGISAYYAAYQAGCPVE